MIPFNEIILTFTNVRDEQKSDKSPLTACAFLLLSKIGRFRFTKYSRKRITQFCSTIAKTFIFRYSVLGSGICSEVDKPSRLKFLSFLLDPAKPTEATNFFDLIKVDENKKNDMRRDYWLSTTKLDFECNRKLRLP